MSSPIPPRLFSAVRLLLGLATCGVACPPTVQAAVVAAYNAGVAGNPASAPDPTSPEGGGWTLNNSTAGDANFTWAGVSPDGTTGSNAWRVLDNTTTSSRFLNYSYALTPQQQADAAATGWRYTGVFRVQDPVASNGGSRSVYLLFGNSVNTRFIAFFDITAAGALDVNFQGTGGATLVLTTNTAQATGYHQHEFLYDPATGKASYRFNGTVLLTNWSGTTGAYNGAKWGTESSGGRGDGYWNSVTFEILDPPQPPVLVENPRSSTNQVGDAVSFSAAFTNLVLGYQWYKDGTPIPGASTPAYHIPFVTVLDAADYVCRATNSSGFADTAPATLTVLADTNPPTVAAVSGSAFAARVRVRFSEPITPATATDTANYEFVGDTLVDLTAVLVDAFTVDLSVQPAPAPGSEHQLRLSGISDHAGNFIANNTLAQVLIPSGLPLMTQLVAAFDGSSAVRAPLDGVKWLDRSGNENHATNPAELPNRRPTLLTNALRGFPTLLFTKTNQQSLSIPAAGSVGLGGSSYTWFFVVKPTLLALPGNVIRHQSSLHPANWGSWFEGSPAGLFVNGRTPAPAYVGVNVAPVTSNAWVIGEGSLDGVAGNLMVRLEDPASGLVLQATNNSGTATGVGTPIATWIGWYSGSTAHGFDGEMAELLLYAGALDDTQRAQVEDYLRAKYFPAPTVAIRPSSSNLVLEFNGTLLSGEEINGITNVVPGATSPLVLSNGLPRQFFRARLP